MPFNLYKQSKTYIKQIERKSSKQEEKGKEKPRSYFSLNEVKKKRVKYTPPRMFAG
jgi:hypothetical protein